MEENRLYAGYAEERVTPPMGLKIPGYYSVRVSDGVITDLYIRAAAFALGEKKAVFFSCDAIGVKADAAAILRPLIAGRCGIGPEAVYLSCTHSHTAFRIDAPSEKDTPNDIFLKRLFQQFCDAAQFAFEDLKPARLKTGIEDAPGVTFKRRYRMKDGSAMTNPPKDKRCDIVAPIGKTDDSVRLLRVIREGGKELLMVCFGMHADGIGGTKYCADFPGFMCSYVKGALGGEAEVLFFNGCEGDVGSRGRMPGVGPFPKRGPDAARRCGRKVAGAVLKLYDDAKDLPCEEIGFCTGTVKVGQNPHTPEQVPIAREMREIYLRVKDIRAPELEPYKEKMNLPEAMRIMANLERPEFFELRLTLLRLGDAAFVGIPGEPFQDIGIAIKEKSPFPVTVVTACTNGHEKYFPTAEAFAEAGYERSTSPYAWDVAEKIEEAALKGLRELYAGKGE